MRSPLKPSVFSTAPEDVSEVVDVYSSNEVKEASVPNTVKALQTKRNEDLPTSPSKTSKAVEKEAVAIHTKKILSSNLSPNEKVQHLDEKAKISDYLATGASSNKIVNMLDTPLPKNIEPYDFLKRVGSNSFIDVKNSLAATSGGLLGEDYSELMPADLTTYMDQALAFMDLAELNHLLCPGELLTGNHISTALRTGKGMIDIRKYIGCNKGKPTIDFTGIQSEYLPTAVRSHVNAAADVGAYDVMVDVLNDTQEVAHTAAYKKEVTDKLLSNYKHKPKTSQSDHANNGTDFVDALLTMDDSWGSYNRDGSTVSDISVFSKASPDALDVLAADPRTSQDALIAKDISVKKTSYKEHASNTYPLLKTA
jgi:hypothetical protein